MDIDNQQPAGQSTASGPPPLVGEGDRKTETQEFVRYKFWAKGTAANGIRYSAQGEVVAPDGYPWSAFEQAADAVEKSPIAHRPDLANGAVKLRKLKTRTPSKKKA